MALGAISKAIDLFRNQHKDKNMPTPKTPSASDIQALPRSLSTTFKGDVHALNQKVVEGRILQSAIEQLQGRPGFNPAAISIVFGLKW
jgi:hypothetical protein